MSYLQAASEGGGMSERYDVVIVGGAMIGSAVAWFLSDNPDFDGTILVVERDPTYADSGTARTNSCMRQQFTTEVNVRISQFAAEFVRDLPNRIEGAPEIAFRSYGYMYLAGDEAQAETMRESQAIQQRLGAGTRTMTPAQILAEYPFYDLDGIVCANHNTVDEGYFDGGTLFDTWRDTARRNGAKYIHDEVVGLDREGDRVVSVRLASGREVSCGHLVVAAGTRAPQVAAMAGIDLPVEPRRRYTFIFDAAEPLSRDLPLTIDPSGVHVRSDGRYYLAGCPPEDDTPPGLDDFDDDYAIWEEKVWPAIAARVPAFERIKLVNQWIGHYDFNTLDQNAIVGFHDEVRNVAIANGFSGHGFQQSPAVGRGIAELITHGGYRSLDLAPLGYERIRSGTPLPERAII